MKQKYWKIYHSPDTTEHGCPTKITYLMTEWEGFPAQQACELELVEDFCYERFGKKVAYVQGVAPCQAWKVYESTEDEFQAAEKHRFSYSPARQVILTIGKAKDYKVIWDEPKTDKAFVCKECGQHLAEEDKK